MTGANSGAAPFQAWEGRCLFYGAMHCKHISNHLGRDWIGSCILNCTNVLEISYQAMLDPGPLKAVAWSLGTNLANSNEFLPQNSQYFPYNVPDLVSRYIRSLAEVELCAERRPRLVRLCPSWTRLIGFVIACA